MDILIEFSLTVIPANEMSPESLFTKQFYCRFWTSQNDIAKVLDLLGMDFMNYTF